MFKTDTSFNVLYTTDIEKTHHFYSQLDLTIKEYKSDKVVVSFGSFDLHFILNTTEPFPNYTYIAEPGAYGQGVIFYIEVDDIVKAKNSVIAAGATIKADIFDDLWDCKELLFEDPNGYKFALYQEIE